MSEGGASKETGDNFDPEKPFLELTVQEIGDEYGEEAIPLVLSVREKFKKAEGDPFVLRDTIIDPEERAFVRSSHIGFFSQQKEETFTEYLDRMNSFERDFMTDKEKEAEYQAEYEKALRQRHRELGNRNKPILNRR